MSEQTKICKRCSEEKTLNDFPKCKACLDGYENICKSCRRKHNPGYHKNYYDNNRTEFLEKNKIYYRNTKEHTKEYRSLHHKKYYAENKDKINSHDSYRYYNDPTFRITKLLRGSLLNKLKKQDASKSQSTLILLGCSIEEFKQHIIQQFLPEMDWNNHGIIWELDHILPCVSFDLTNEEEQKKCFHYTNYQPLFKTTEIAESFGYVGHIGNRNKGDKIL